MYHVDLQTVFAPSTMGVVDEITLQEFHCSIRCNKSHYTDLKDDKYFSVWNRGFMETACMHHNHNILDEKYVKKTVIEIHVFWEMQTLMYAVFEEHIKTDRGKLLVSEYEDKQDDQSITPRVPQQHRFLEIVCSNTLPVHNTLVIGMVLPMPLYCIFLRKSHNVRSGNWMIILQNRSYTCCNIWLLTLLI
jgi:hypothetical protein